MKKLFSFEHKRRINMGDRDVVTHGLYTEFWQDIYYYAMTLSWPIFFVAIGLMFLMLNLLFASLFMLGDHAIDNLSPDNFLGAFFFSVETLATVGYGDMHPRTVYGHSIATTEIFIGMSCVALITGVMFARFSRPRSSVVFAEYPVSYVEGEQRQLLIRMANARLNIISEASAKMHLIKDEKSQYSGNFRKLIDLKLVREQHPVFVLGWTLIHVIDESSPLYGETVESLTKSNAALILSVAGVDETTNQSLHARHYYSCASIRWNHRYTDMFSIDENQTQHIDYGDFHQTEALSEFDDFSDAATAKSEPPEAAPRAS